MMTDQKRESGPVLRVRDLARQGGNPFSLTPDAAALNELGAELGLLDLRKVAFKGSVTPAGSEGWDLRARLGATVVQPCVVTLEPVTTRIEEEVIRRYRIRLPDIEEGGEVEMPEDETLEPLGATIDLRAVLAESLALALPPYPRAGDAEAGSAVFTGPGIAPMSDDDAKPFAGLADLRDKMRDRE
jgi:uncharacterized metal-binding protein YceD (DUF177 family)